MGAIRNGFVALMSASTIGSAVYDFAEQRMGASTSALAGTCARPTEVFHPLACPLLAGSAVTSMVEGVGYYAYVGLKRAVPRVTQTVRSL